MGIRIPIVTSEEMCLADQAMTQEYGISSSVLMENAAASVFALLNRKLPDIYSEKFLILVGPGKNGEDGLVLARQLLLTGINTTTVILPPMEKLSLEYQRKVNTLKKIGATILNDVPNMGDYSVLVDAIFGIGLSRPPSGVYMEAIEEINSSKAMVISLDLPSGIDADDGSIMGIAVRCNYCVSFGGIKIGNLMNYGYTHCNYFFLSLLHAPYFHFFLSKGVCRYLNIPTPLPGRDKGGYKNSFGSCLVVGGSSQYHGAPYFASSAFMKAGGGYAHLLSIEEVTQSVGITNPECVLHPFRATIKGTLPSSAFEDLEKLGESQDVIILGPGLGISDDTDFLLARTLKSTRLAKIPLLLDGDALTLLGGNIELLENRTPYTTILTPHIGEMARLTGYSIETIITSPVKIAEEFSRKWKILLVLKGPRSVIATNEFVYINTSGTEALATAGSGDVLDGIIGAFCSSELGIVDGLRNAVFLHGFIGNLFSKQGDARSVTATDILHGIPGAIREFASLFSSLNENETPKHIPGVSFLH